MRPSLDEINRVLAEASDTVVAAEPAADRDDLAPPAAAETVLDELHAAGVRVEAREGRLRLSPASSVGEALAARVRLHKAAILALLASRPPLPDATETWLAAVDRLAAEQEIPPDVLAELKSAKVKWR